MNLRVYLVIVALALISPLALAGGSDKATGSLVTAPRMMQSELLGTWKYVSGMNSGKEVKFPEGITPLKHITPTHFTVVGYNSKDGSVIWVIGGTYTVRGDLYEETPLYGMIVNFPNLRGNLQTYRWRVEQNLWKTAGKLSTGSPAEEVWEKVEQR